MGVGGDADQGGLGLEADAFAEAGHELAGGLGDGDDGGAIGDADDGTGLAFKADDIASAETIGIGIHRR